MGDSGIRLDSSELGGDGGKRVVLGVVDEVSVTDTGRQEPRVLADCDPCYRFAITCAI